MASRSRSCALPIWSPCASLNAATSAPSKNPRPSTQAALNAKTPKVSSISAMPDFPRTALRTAGEGGPSPKGLVGEGRAASGDREAGADDAVLKDSAPAIGDVAVPHEPFE